MWASKVLTTKAKRRIPLERSVRTYFERKTEMKYTIGFKSGKILELDVKDGVEFVKDIVAGVSTKPDAPVQWHCEPGLVLVVSEIEFIVPSHIMQPSV